MQVDEEVHSDLVEVMRKESQNIADTYSTDSFQHLQKQQHKAQFNKYERYALAPTNDSFLLELATQIQ